MPDLIFLYFLMQTYHKVLKGNRISMPFYYYTEEKNEINLLTSPD